MYLSTVSLLMCLQWLNKLVELSEVLDETIHMCNYLRPVERQCRAEK